MAAWSKKAEAVAQTALQTGTAVDDFYHAIGILATLHARKVISADLNTKQVGTAGLGAAASARSAAIADLDCASTNG